jgi:PadR family transcriptional regulator, regulatory protein PadR
MKGDHIGEFEELVLLAVHGLGDAAYSVPIQELLERETTRSVSLGAVYAALTRLEEKGLLTSGVVAGAATRGGRSRRTFELTSHGSQTIAALRRVRDRLYRAGLRSSRGRA